MKRHAALVRETRSSSNFIELANQVRQMPRKITLLSPPFTGLLFLVLAATVSLSFLPETSRAKEIYRYIENTGPQTSFFTWQLDFNNELMATVTSREEKVLYVNICDQSGATCTWRMEKEDVRIWAQRRGNELYVRGREAGEPIEKVFSLDSAPWFQPLSYSLRRFLATDEQKQVFWMIRLDKLKPMKFQAVREGVEEIATTGSKCKAVKIKISPTGLFSCFWHAYYWFRQEDGLFLRYEGTHGPPGTPKTIINLAPPATSHN